MAEKSREQLKGYFQPYLRPTGNQFEDLIDSFVSRLDDDFVASLPDATTEQKGIVEEATLDEVAAVATDQTRFVTPAGAKKSVETFAPGLAPVQSINGQTGDVVLELSDTTNVVGSYREGIVKFHNAPGSLTNIYHIKLPYKIDVHNDMYYIKASGYAFATSEVIDIVWVGYCYANGAPGNNHIRTSTEILRSTSITAGQYIGSDNHIYLWLRAPNTNHTTFKLDTIRVGNGTLLEEGDLEVIISSATQL